MIKDVQLIALRFRRFFDFNCAFTCEPNGLTFLKFQFQCTLPWRLNSLLSHFLAGLGINLTVSDMSVGCVAGDDTGILGAQTTVLSAEHQAVG